MQSSHYYFIYYEANFQTILLQGKVIDSNAIPIAYAHVSVFRNRQLVAPKISAEDGTYILSVDGIGIYELKEPPIPPMNPFVKQ